MFNDLPIVSIFGMLGTLLSLFGIFMLLAGLKIINVQNITVATGPRTAFIGILFLVLGLALLIPETRMQMATTIESPQTGPAVPSPTVPLPETPTEAVVVQASAIPTGSISAERPPTEPVALVEVEVAAGKPATASGYWQHPTIADYAFEPATVVDRQKEEINCKSGEHTYWLLPNEQPGWVQVDLTQEYQITRIRWLNTHNSQCMDRAAENFHIEIATSRDFSDAAFVYAGQMDLRPEPLYGQYTLPFPLPARYVRFYVDSYHGAGGGLNEIEVYAEVPAE